MTDQATSLTRRTSASRDQGVELRDIIGFLNEHLGAHLLALTVGVNPRTVGRWLTDPERTLRFDSEMRLREAYQIFRAVQEVEASPTVRAWFMGMNPQLEDRSPAEAIRDGDARDVMAAARAFVNAG